MPHLLADRPTRGALLASILGVLVLASVSTARAASLPKLSLKLTSSSISVSGAVQSGGVEVVTANTGKKEAGALLFRLNPGVSLSEVEAFLKTKKSKDPNAAGKYGSIVFDAEAPSGHSSAAQTSLAPGEYLALGAPGEGPPKFYTAFTVTPASAPASLPKPQATISSIEFDFRGPTTLRDGELVRFQNLGYLVHMDYAFPVKGKSAAKQAVHDLLTGKQKGLKTLIAGKPIALQGLVSHGAYQQERIDAKPGWYVQACFMETQEGVPHTQLGMERAIRIVK